MIMDCWVSRDNKVIFDEVWALLQTGWPDFKNQDRILSSQGFKRDNYDRASDRMSYNIAKFNYEVDTNNKYYKELFDKASNIWDKWKDINANT